MSDPIRDIDLEAVDEEQEGGRAWAERDPVGADGAGGEGSESDRQADVVRDLRAARRRVGGRRRRVRSDADGRLIFRL